MKNWAQLFESSEVCLRNVLKLNRDGCTVCECMKFPFKYFKMDDLM